MAAVSGEAGSLLIRGALLWDGSSPEPRPDTEILVEAGVIRDVRRATVQAPPAGARILDLGGSFLMPGLIDTHVHLVWSGSSDPVPVVADEGEQLTAVRALANAQAHLRAGITTVRDLGGNWDVPVAVAKAVDRGYVQGPRILAAGRTVIMTGGHDPFWGIPSDGPAAVVATVRRQASIGAKVIKVSATGGVYGQPEGEEIGQSQLTFEELAAAAFEAHRFGLKSCAHALGNEGIRNSVLAGIDTIEHGHFLDEEIVREMVARGTSFSPTLLTYKNIASGGEGNIPDYAVQKSRRSLKAHRESFQMAMEAGIPIVAGTDAGSPDLPHPSLLGELRTMLEYGMPVQLALKSATSVAAGALGRGGSLGSIEAGKIADLLVLDGNPFEDLEALSRVRMVFRSGVAV